MANTTNIDLVKPAGTDHALVSVLNANSDKIDAEAGNVRSNFALVQNTNTATQAISKDQLVVWKGVLKNATSNIANGATLSNSNLTDTKVSTELASLSDQIANLAKRIIATKTVTVSAGDKLSDQRVYFTIPSGYIVVSVVPTVVSAEMFCITIGNISENSGTNASYISFGIRNLHTSDLERTVSLYILLLKSSDVS